MKPPKPIRRFDVFAEYRKLDAQSDGNPVDQAKAHGLWVAKVVAARKFRRQETAEQSSHVVPSRRRKWHVLSGTPQTDKLFDHEIIERIASTRWELNEQVFGVKCLADAELVGPTAANYGLVYDADASARTFNHPGGVTGDGSNIAFGLPAAGATEDNVSGTLTTTSNTRALRRRTL